MFNYKTLFILLLIASSGGIAAHAGEQVFKGEIWDNLCAKEGSHAAMMKKAGVNTTAKCTIGCAMTRGKYVLYNPGTKQVYQLDDQKRPLEFAGKAVQVKLPRRPPREGLCRLNL